MRRAPSAVASFLLVACIASAALAPTPAAAEAADDPLRLRSDLDSPQLVGTTITWRLESPDTAYDYRLGIARPGGPFQIVYDYSDRTAFPWTPLDAGSYHVVLEARNRQTHRVRRVWRPFRVSAPEEPSVWGSEHPLVALYSARPFREHPLLARRCTRPGAGCRLRVLVRDLDSDLHFSTQAKPIAPGRPTSLYIAGLPELTSYSAQHEVVDAQGHILALGPVLHNETGKAEFDAPATRQLVAPSEAALAAPYLLATPLVPVRVPYAVDLEGRLVWYDGTAGVPTMLTRMVEGGTFLELLRDGQSVLQSVLREIDLAGSTIRETTQRRVSEQVEALGGDPILAFHHEARRLPGNRTAILAYVAREVPDTSGLGVRGVLGDMIVVLDRNFQVVWTWNAFDHVDVERRALLGESCRGGNRGGCPGFPEETVAEDWLHSNAITYSPRDGNLLVSVRHQDWIIKIDYSDGAGSGLVLWRLGPEGDFAIESDTPSPWFTHSHDPNFLPDGRLAVYDNGNTRCAREGDCESRGLVYELDEENRVARLVVEERLGFLSVALGSAQPLANGGLHFNSGIGLSPEGDTGGVADEFAHDGTLEVSLFQEALVYRSFRLRDLYTPPPRPRLSREGLRGGDHEPRPWELGRAALRRLFAR